MNVSIRDNTGYGKVIIIETDNSSKNSKNSTQVKRKTTDNIYK